MDEIYKKTFTNCHTYLVDNILYDDLADLIFQHEVLPRSTIEDINSVTNRREKVRKLLEALPRRSNETFETFLQCLKDSNQNHIAKKLTDKLNEIHLQTLSNLFQNNFLPPSKEPHSFVDCESLSHHTKLPGKSLPEQDTESTKSEVSTSMMCSEANDHQLTLPEPPQAMESDCYEMNTQPRGYLLIINNENFLGTFEQRSGSSKDAIDLKELFWRLGFHCDIFSDLKIREMKSVLSRFAKIEDHKNLSCCALALMSHGDENNIFGIQGEKIPVNELISYFNDQNCPNLKNKPKLFIIQTCRNNNPTTNDTRNENVSTKTVKSTTVMRLMSLDLSSDSKPKNKESVNTNSRADMLIAYSTASGNVSYRSRVRGSIFIQSIIEVFNEKAHSTSVTDMLIEVNRKLRERYPCQEQIGVPEVALTKKWYLKPTS